MNGPVESFYKWWDEHKAKGELNGVDKPDALMIWIEAYKTLGGENERPWIQLCYINPDGSHVRGCAQHAGRHPANWCERSPDIRYQQ
jgi:hypothetical protein